MTEPKYPEHVKLRAVADHSQVIFDFMQWIDSKGIRLATWHGDGPFMDPVHTPVRDLLAEFFEIDQKKLEDEKDAMLEEQRKLNAMPEFCTEKSCGRSPKRGTTCQRCQRSA